MKILLVSEDVPAPKLGGLGKHVVRLGNALIQAGHTVALLGTSHYDYEACRAEVGFAGHFEAGFSLAGTGWKESRVGAFLPYKRLAIAKRIARAILERASDYDVVHYHGHYPMVGRYIPERVNFLQTRHDQGSECLTQIRFKQGNVCRSSNPEDCAACALNAGSGIFRQALSNWAVRQYRSETAKAFARHRTIFVSDFLRRAFLRHVPAATSSKLHVLHNFIDVQTLPISQVATTRQVLFVGRIDEAKGVMALLDELSRIDHDWQINIIGDGPLRSACESSHASNQVHFLGWKLQAEALEATAQAKRIVVPSIWEEPCGTTILEGLALGKPVYALARGGTPELAQYERWPGQLHLFEDMASLARALVMPETEEPAGQLPPGFGADVSAIVPRLVQMYVHG